MDGSTHSPAVGPPGGSLSRIESVVGRFRDLERSVPPGRRTAARSAAMARVVEVAASRSLDLGRFASVAGGPGMLVLDGALLHSVMVDGRHRGDVVASGDLLSAPRAERLVRSVTTWTAITRTRLALLGPRWTARMAPYPEVVCALVARGVTQSRRLAALAAIGCEPLLDVRVWRLFWYLADRFGEVRPDGVHIPLPLTHEALAVLAGDHRPSVSTVVGALTARGFVRRSGHSWVLTGELRACPSRRPSLGGVLDARRARQGPGGRREPLAASPADP